MKFAYQQLTFEKGHFLRHQSLQLLKSINCSVCFCRSRIRKERSLIDDKISTLMISERSLDFGNLLTLGIYIFS